MSRNKLPLLQNNKTCKLCEGQTAYEMTLENGVAVRVCAECGLLTAKEWPLASDFIPGAHLIYSRRAALLHSQRQGRLALERYDRIKKYLSPSSKILEFGSGTGEFLHLLSHYGYQVEGVEPSYELAEYARDELNLNVRLGLPSRIHLAPESQDLIYCFQAIERVEDPVRMLHQIAQWLRPGGKLIIECSNFADERFDWAHIERKSWKQLLNKETLQLLTKHAGLELLSLEPVEKTGELLGIFTRGEILQLQTAHSLPWNCEKTLEILLKGNSLHALRRFITHTRELGAAVYSAAVLPLLYTEPKQLLLKQALSWQIMGKTEKAARGSKRETLDNDKADVLVDQYYALS